MSDSMTLESVEEQAPDNVTRIYACATVWHETREELLNLLESILRLDEDQWTRRMTQRHLRIVDPDYYELETHIFLDDAFEVDNVYDLSNRVNKFVKSFVATVDEAVFRVCKADVRLTLPAKIVTPYGGRMVWTLPRRTKMVLHLKDRTKIRIKKRWSQVMYMHFLLGHCLTDLPIAEELRKTRAENTYLLTLDGDVSFRPHAVLQLVDLMKQNKNLGAACGRLHPVGDGPLAWYQTFEYAITHWLQKTTENLVGCVLCSPGCFSLYRAEALMNEKVIRKYTAKPEKARHYVQYDLGEDRWLSTLLLQAGYRVEYAATSDAYTHCPESFSEFFNQRRRWIPSTAANLLDSLLNYKRIVNANESINHFYILYQFLLMILSIVMTGTIFLMLVEIFVDILRIDKWTSLYFNMALTSFFVLVCFVCKPEKQLLVARILSTFYALFAMASFMGVILQIRREGAGSAILFILTWSAIAIAALLHPREMGCIVHAVVFIILVPTTYFLMNLYSIINVNNISWGTREVQAEKMQPNKFGPMRQTEGDEMNLQLEIRRSNVEKYPSACTFGIRSTAVDEFQGVKRIEDDSKETEAYLTCNSDPRLHRGAKNGLSRPEDARDNITPSWIRDKDLQGGPVVLLASHENEFWIDLIKKCLYPLDEDEREKAKITRNLRHLRNRVAFVFLTINVVFVAVVFFVQVHEVRLLLEWPLFIRMIPEVDNSNRYLRLEPIGLVYILSLTTQIIQFGGMIVHRFNSIRCFLTSLRLRLVNFCRRKLHFVKTSTLQQHRHLVDQVKSKGVINSIRNLRWLDGRIKEDEIYYGGSNSLNGCLGNISPPSTRISRKSLWMLNSRN